MRVLNRPIENIEDRDEQLVASLVAHLAPIIEPWRSGEDLREEEMLLEQKVPGLKAALAAVERAGRELSDRRSGLLKSPAVIGPIAGGVVLLGAGMAISALGGIGMIAGLLAIGAGVYLFMSKRSAIDREISQNESERTARDLEIQKTEANIASLKKQMETRGGGFPNVVAAEVAFSLKSADLAGNNVIVDMSSTVRPVNLGTVDLKPAAASAAEIVARARDIATVPVLLDPQSAMEQEDPVDRIYGEEDRLRSIVETYIAALRNVSDIRITLPLVQSTTQVAKRMTQGGVEVATGGVLRIEGAVTDLAKVGGFLSQVNEAKTTGAAVLGNLREAHELLTKACGAYSMARTESINHLHQNVYDVLNRASWCSKRFFCPRTIQSQTYLEDLLNVHPEDAHLLEFDELASRLRKDPAIARRIADKPELLDALYMAHRALSEDFAPEAEHDITGAPTGHVEVAGYVRAQSEENLKQFRLSLTKVLTGTSQPVLGLSMEARLFYDPDLDEWRSTSAPYVYSTAEVQRYGQVLKVHSDLLMPLWEHLWTEKADFRKSETFRTNESLIRMTEKESEKLIEIGNQFRADMRPVRENVNTIESDLRAKINEIRQFRDSMREVGLLSDQQAAALSDSALEAVALNDEPVLKRAHDIESWLGFEPRAQAERRGVVRDPIDIARSPDALIAYDASKTKAVRFSLELGAPNGQ